MTYGVAALVAAVVQMAYPSSKIGTYNNFACLIFYFVLGWKVYSLSGALQVVAKIRERAGTTSNENIELWILLVLI